MPHFQDFPNGKLYVFDGGIGTELYERGFYINRPFEELNLSFPQDVQAVHEAYINAGADVITTNSFSITGPQLKKFDIQDKQEALLKAAIAIANSASLRAQENGKKTPLIAVSVGPTGALIEPLGPTSHEEAQNSFREVAEIAQRSEAFDCYILETFSQIAELEDAIIGIRSVDTAHPIVASMSLKSSQKKIIEEFATRIGARNDVQALGVNCSQGPSDLYSVAQILKPLTNKGLVIQPNAGIPNHVNGRYFYMTSPDYMAKYARRYVELGAIGVGGCCGTGPAHITALARALAAMKARSESEIRVSQEYSIPKENRELKSEKLSIPKKSRVLERLQQNKKFVSIEILPPKGVELTKFLKQVQDIDNFGIPFINVPDGARASTRVSSLHLASFINRDAHRKVRVLPHFTTRDRNLIALQSDLLGAYINNVYDILVVTGDPPKLGNNRDATGVFDIDSIGLTFMLKSLNEGHSPTGEDLGSQSGFGIGVAANPTAINMELEKSRFIYKVESGADYAITQPIFDPESYLRWRDSIPHEKWRPHMLGIWPLISLRNAEFLANEVPGIKVPNWILEKMRQSENNAAESTKRGIAIAQEIMQKLENACDGFCISAPLGKIEVALQAADSIKNLL